MIKIGVVSGKGGVGKSTVAVSLAVALARRGMRVGLVDVDVTCPNVHDILGRGELGVSRDDRFVPAESMGVKYISIGQLASEGDPVLWDPEDVRSAARQLLERTEWGELDYAVFDFPPGFGAEVLELMPMMDYLLIVAVPSSLSKSKARRVVEAAREFGVPILGVVKNMSYFTCPSCGSRHRVFPEDCGFEELGVPTIAELPLDPRVAEEKYVADFPIDAVLRAMERPAVLRRRRSLLRRALEALLRGSPCRT